MEKFSKTCWTGILWVMTLKMLPLPLKKWPNVHQYFPEVHNFRIITPQATFQRAFSQNAMDFEKVMRA